MVKVEIKSRAQMAESIRRLDVNTFTIISQETGQSTDPMHKSDKLFVLNPSRYFRSI